MEKERGISERDAAEHGSGGIYTEAAASFATSLLENSNDLVAAIDTGLRFVAVNAPFRREFELVFGKPIRAGQRIDELLGHLTHDRDKAVALCRRALSGEAFRVIEDFGDNQLLRKSYELAFTPIFDTRRQPIFAAIVVRDLTMVRVSEKRFGPLLEVAPDATIIVRKDGRIDVANALVERMFGYARHQMLGMPVEMLVPERFRARHVAQRNTFALQPTSRPMGGGKSKLLGVRADGTEFPVEISLSPLDVDGESMVVAAVRDVTVRQQTEDELRAHSAELAQRVEESTIALEKATKAFRATFEQASVGIAHVDLQGRWVRVNDRLCETVGYTKEELATMTFQHITHPEDLNSDLQLMYRLLAGDIPFYTMDKRYIHKNGSAVWINLNASLVRDSEGVPEYFIAVVKDISDRKHAEAELQRSKESLELAIESAGIGMFDNDPQTDTNLWNDEIKRHFGFPPDVNINYNLFLQVLHPEDRDRVDALVQQTLRPESGGNFHTQYRVIRLDDKSERWIEGRGKSFFDKDGKPIRFIGTTLDITEKKHAEDESRLRENQLRLMFEANPIGTVRGTSNGKVIDANAAYLRIIGCSREDLLEGRLRWDQLTPPEYLKKDRKAMAQAKQYGVSDLYEKEYIRPDGTRVPILIACAVIGGKEDDLVAFVLDITERKQAEERIRQTALHDSLTGLPNRGLLFDYAKHVFRRSRRAQRHSAILFIDLDRFKPINDTHGHEVGDAVLKEVAKRIEKCTRGDDIVFRLGGDEFLVLLPEVEDDANAGDVARHVLECLHQPYYINGFELFLSGSIGISLYPRDGEGIDTLISNADAAMYLAKQGGRNNIQFYSEELAARSRRQLQIEEHIKTALTQNTFRLYYQPLVDMHTSMVLGVEALVRWEHDEIGPDQFVPVAEATGHIGRLSDWVISEACRQHLAWREHGLPPIPIAVNVSAVQLRHQDFADNFFEAMRECLVDSSALQVEVTETAVMENLDRAIDVLARLNARGIEIALDDFGTGYSSLNYLSRLPISKIKVDKSFIQRVSNDSTSRAITEAVIALGRSMGLEVVAEGIESEETLHYLRRQGCSQAQGYHVCRPVSADAFEAWFETHGGASKH